MGLNGNGVLSPLILGNNLDPAGVGQLEEGGKGPDSWALPPVQSLVSSAFSSVS